ncbi:hypothetical protein TcWFU_010545 [Taenia crassiceps]|uniref:Uncharacterized protein n=1 Tax=Taenia crassiceps TaxID=6207 RepID=A0ABR4Q8G7_9CEST
MGLVGRGVCSLVEEASSMATSITSIHFGQLQTESTDAPQERRALCYRVGCGYLDRKVILGEGEQSHRYFLLSLTCVPRLPLPYPPLPALPCPALPCLSLFSPPPLHSASQMQLEELGR